MVRAKKSEKAVEFAKKFPKSRRTRLRGMAESERVKTGKLNVFSPGHCHPLLTHADDEEWQQLVHDSFKDLPVKQKKSDTWLSRKIKPLVYANASLLINSISEVITANMDMLRDARKKKPLVVVALDTAGKGDSALEKCTVPPNAHNNELSRLVFIGGGPVVVTDFKTVVDRPNTKSLSARQTDNVHILLARNTVQAALLQLMEKAFERNDLGVLVKTVLLHDGTWNMSNAIDIVSATYAEADDLVASRQPGRKTCNCE